MDEPDGLGIDRSGGNGGPPPPLCLHDAGGFGRSPEDVREGGERQQTPSYQRVAPEVAHHQ